MLPRISVRTCLSSLLAITMVVAAVPLLPAPPVAQALGVLPSLPNVYLDTTYSPPSGATIAIPAGGDFQGALNSAHLGDIITLQAGATYTGPFTLPNKSGSGWIYIRSSALASLPAPGTRVSPAQANLMPKIVVGSNNGGAIQTAQNAHNYRFIGIEFAPLPGQFVYDVIQLGAGETDASALPYAIV